MASTPPTSMSLEDRPLHRPIPTRYASLQSHHSGPRLTPKSLGSTPPDYSYTSAASTSPPRDARPLMLSRPGGPTRSHSFCGDSSASTYALASARTGTHLTGDKRMLVAPPLERTLSSIGVVGNNRPRTYPIPRPAGLQPTLITPPASPPRTSLAVPQILVSSPSPSRPGLNPIQRSSSPIPADRSFSDSSSRAPSFALVTPTDSLTTIPLVPSPDTSTKRLPNQTLGADVLGVHNYGTVENDD